MKFEIQTSEIEKIIYKNKNDKYDTKWWNWQLANNGFEYNEGRYHHKDLPNITINVMGGEVSICCWYNRMHGVQLFNCTMRNSKKAIDFIKNKLEYDNYKKWLEN